MTSPTRLAGHSLNRRRPVVVASIAGALFTALFVVLGATPELWVDHPGRKAESLRWRTSTALADTSLLLLAATLALGPIRTIKGAAPATHLPWRRTLGVAAGLTALAHVVIGMTVHGDLLRPLPSFVTGWPTADDPVPIVRTARGYANIAGLTAATVLVALMLLSQNAWIRRLGASRWKMLQRSAYAAFVMIGLHALYYWRVEQRLLAHRGAVLALILAVSALQLTAALRHLLANGSQLRTASVGGDVP